MSNGILIEQEDFFPEEIDCSNVTIEEMGALLDAKIQEENKQNKQNESEMGFEPEEDDDDDWNTPGADKIALYVARSLIDGLPLYVTESQKDMEETMNLPRKSVSARLCSNSSGRNTQIKIEKIYVLKSSLDD